MKKHNKLLWVVLVVLIGTAIYLLSANGGGGKTSVRNIPKKEVAEPQFVKEGQLWFIKKQSRDTLRRIDIEIANDAEERAKGLMHRTNMPDDRGMLFIFNQEDEQSFWMKNTLISLDIMYVNKDKEIVTIYKHTQPYSENPIPSFKKAMYVVETIAGFCDKYHVEEGDFIEFTENEIADKSS
ncbi:MAG: DUF192 domain-containing protein [Cytophagales bacterium]|nr:DUF192 domain-containing protein [Cytophagales bacterium]